MIVSFKTISLLLLALIFTFVHAQNSSQTPTAPSTPQPTPTPNPAEPHLAASQPAAAQAHPVPAGTPTPPSTEHTQNIETNDAHPATPEPQAQHHENPSVAKEQPQPTQHVAAAEHHQPEPHKDEQHMTHEQIQKALQQMNDQELKHFEDSLQGEAREYYQQLLKEDLQQEHAEDVQYEEEYKQVERELTKTDKERTKEEEQFSKQENKFIYEAINYNEYLFQLDEANSQDFRISIPNAQQIIFHGYTYENSEGTYSVTSNIQEQQPIKLVVYQNSRIVYQKTFFFKYFGSYMGNENCTYLFRFVNPTQHKLVALNIGVMFENGHMVDKLTVHDVANHGRRLNVFQNEVTNKYTDMSMKSVIENENRQTLINKLDHYFTYSIVEIVMILLLCALQVEFVKKLLSTNNVV